MKVARLARAARVPFKLGLFLLSITGCSATRTALRPSDVGEKARILVLSYDPHHGPDMQQDSSTGATMAAILGGMAGEAIYTSIALKKVSEQAPLLQTLSTCGFPATFTDHAKAALSRRPGWTVLSFADLGKPVLSDPLIRHFFTGKEQAEDKEMIRDAFAIQQIDAVLLLEIQHYGLRTLGMIDKPSYDVAVKARLLRPFPDSTIYLAKTFSARTMAPPLKYLDLPAERVKRATDVCPGLMDQGDIVEQALASALGISSTTTSAPKISLSHRD